MSGAARVLRGVGLTSLWALIFLACLEIGLRLAPQAVPLSVLQRFEPGMRSEIAARRNLTRREDTVLLPRDDGGPPGRMWFYQPGLTVTNHEKEEGMVPQARMDRNGLCNSPADIYDAPRFDVVALGDSFTWCTAVAPGDAWPARLAAITGLSIYNAGIGGRGPYEYIQILKYFGLAKRPSAVVMAIYEGNDFRDAHRFHRARADADSEEEAAVCAFTWAAVCSAHAALDATALRRLSYAYNLFSATVHVLAYTARKIEVDFGYEVRFRDGVTLHFNSENSDRDEVQYARWLVEGQLGPQLFDEALTSFAELARSQGFVAWVVYLPSAYTAYEGMSRFDDPAVEAPLRDYSLALRHYFRTKSEELGLRFLDATPELQRASLELPSSRRLYFRTNVHLTPEGHEHVAGLVARELDDLRRGSAARSGKLVGP